jgi:hypothetical protein
MLSAISAAAGVMSSLKLTSLETLCCGNLVIKRSTPGGECGVLQMGGIFEAKQT